MELEAPHTTPSVSPCIPTNMSSIPVFHHYREAMVNFAAGTVGGITTVYVGQPLDTLKVKMQTFPHMYPNMLSCFRNTFRKDGLRGLYAGTIPAVVANVAENSVLFAAYGMCQRLIAFSSGVKRVEDLSTLGNATAGFFAAFFSSLTLCPTELLKCRLQSMQEIALKENRIPERIGCWKLTQSILRTEGVAGLFRGLTSTFSREMPGYFFFFGSYEATRSLLTPTGKTKEDLGPLATVICGGVAGTTLWVVMFPTDVVKSRIQVTGSTKPMLLVLKEIIKFEGVAALYNGLGPTVIRTFPATGALFLAYEWTKKILNDSLP